MSRLPPCDSLRRRRLDLVPKNGLVSIPFSVLCSTSQLRLQIIGCRSRATLSLDALPQLVDQHRADFAAQVIEM